MAHVTQDYVAHVIAHSPCVEKPYSLLCGLRVLCEFVGVCPRHTKVTVKGGGDSCRSPRKLGEDVAVQGARRKSIT